MQRADALRRPPRAPALRVTTAWLAMLGLGLALRLACAWIASGPDATAGSDPELYDSIAWNLASGAGFSVDSAAGPSPTARVPPLVPWLTSLVYRAVGHRDWAAVLLQCTMGALVPLLLAAFGGLLFGGAIGRWSGWVATVDPVLVLFSGSRTAETTLCATLLLALWLSAAWVRAPRGGRALGTGLGWGVATLTHPTAMLLPAVVAAWGWRPLGLTLGGRGRLRQIGLLLLGLALAVGPWTLRNALALRAFVPVTTGAITVTTRPAAWDHTGWQSPGPPPALPGDLDPLLAWSVATLPFALWGAVRALRGGRRWFQALPLLVISYCLLAAAMFSDSRLMRVPAESLVALLVALGLEDALRAWRARRRRLSVVPGRRQSGLPREP